MTFVNLLLMLIYSLVFIITPIASFASLNQGLVAYFPFNGNAQDESEYHNNSTVNEATLAQDRFGNENSSYYFNGQNSYIEIPDCSHLQLENISTLCIWINIPEKTNTNEVIISKFKSDTPDEDGYAIMLDIESNLQTVIKNGNGDKFDNLKAPFDNYNSWTFLCMVIRDDKKLVFYIDGEKVYESEYLLQSPVGSSQSVLVGAAHYYNGQISPYSYYKGYIDDIRVYNRVLSVSEIQQLYMLDSSCPIEYLKGFDSGKKFCIDNPNECGIDGLYTEEDMQNMVNQLLQWDVNKDNKLGLVETIKILRDTAGIIKSPQD